MKLLERGAPTYTHQPCLACDTRQDDLFRESRAKVCESCRPEYELQRFGTTCFGCHTRKMPERFPILNPTKFVAGEHVQVRYPRRTAYCLDCIDRYSTEVAKGKALAAVAMEFGVARKTLDELYKFWRRWHPEAPPVSPWKTTRLNSRGQMVRRCRGCRRHLVVKPENFYRSHTELPEDSPQHWDYLCKRCRSKVASAYNRDKRLQGDQNFYERRRAAQRRWVAEHPEEAEAARQRYIARKAAGEVVPLSERRTHDHDHPRVHRGPFLEWLEEVLPKYPGITEFADLVGIPARTLLRLRTDGGKWIELDTVDRALQAEGGTMLHELYPYEEEERAA